MKGPRKNAIIIGETSEDLDASEATEAARTGFALASELAGTGGTFWLVTPTLNELGSHRAITDFLGSGEKNSLVRRGEISYGDQVLRHASRETLHRRGVEGIILTIYPRPELLADLDDLHDEHVLIVVPGIRKDVAAWIHAWGPYNFVTGVTLPALTISDAEVREAVESVVERANNLFRPTDETWARSMFARLRRRHAISADEVRAFVVRETHWRTDDAEHLARIAAGRKGSV